MEKFEKKLKIGIERSGEKKIEEEREGEWKDKKTERKTERQNKALKQELIGYIGKFDLEKAQDILDKKEIIIDADIADICQKKMEFIIGPKGCGIDGIEDFISFFQEYKILSKEQITAVIQKKLESDLSKEKPLSSKEINKCRKIISIAQENNLKIQDSLLKKFQEKETEQKESPAEIIGFERFDTYDMSGKEIQGKEILEKAAEILPNGLHCANIEKIEYEDRTDQMPDEYGIKGNSTALYDTSEKAITFFLIPDPDYKKQNYIEDFPCRIAHEFGHSIDPREIEQEDLSLSECREMLKQWAMVRKEEPPFSLYVEKINNENKWTEDSLKSKEDFAESMSFTLINPLYMKIFAPKRYKFCVSWLKKRFPKFDIKKIAEKNEEYFKLLDNLNLN